MALDEARPADRARAAKARAEKAHAANLAIEPRAQDLQQRVGHPRDKWESLQARVQDQGVEQFAEVQPEWLDLMWTLDAYRVAQVPPSGMGDLDKMPAVRLGGVYRGKGNWFATLLALLLANQTNVHLAPKTKVQGFSQLHQIDIAWPARLEDPLVCAETKLTGAPGFGDTPARGAMSDWTNRRKELKFAAADLKLYRRQAKTSIKHWGVWREQQPPKAYFLWAARLRPEDRITKMVTEAQALVNTYLDGAGLFAFRESDDAASYVQVPLAPSAFVTDLDDVLLRIATEIGVLAGPNKSVPAPQKPDDTVVDVNTLMSDSTKSD